MPATLGALGPLELTVEGVEDLPPTAGLGMGPMGLGSSRGGQGWGQTRRKRRWRERVAQQQVHVQQPACSIWQHLMEMRDCYKE